MKTKSNRKRVYITAALTLLLVVALLPASGYATGTAARSTAPEWFNQSNGLIAHGSGAINGHLCTNSLDAVRANYSLGHRVFEMDFNMTSDGLVVAVHDWDSWGGVKSTKEFMNIRALYYYKPAIFHQIIEFMAKHKDMYLITDTKSFEYTDDEILAQFRSIYNIAREAGDDVLNRIIIQIYNRDMYDLVSSIYRFPNMIYTLYMTHPDEQHRVLPFMLQENITLIAMPPERATDEYLGELRSSGITVFLHTINDVDVAIYWMGKGVGGIYTDTILPCDLP